MHNAYVFLRDDQIDDLLLEEKQKGCWKGKDYRDTLNFAPRKAMRGHGDPKIWYSLVQVKFDTEADYESFKVDCKVKKMIFLLKDQARLLGMNYEYALENYLYDMSMIEQENPDTNLSIENMFDVMEVIE
jgi:hypothetical protein